MKKGLFIGIDDYPRSPLVGAVRDATEISTILATNGDGSPNFDTNLQTNVKTRGEVRQLIKRLFDGNPEVALLYFSGHGTFNPYGGYIVTPDASNYDEGVSLEEILKLANESRAVNKVIILDSCFSGDMANLDIAKNNGALLVEGMTIFTSSRADEVSEEVGGYGIFTSLLNLALQGGAADITGNITPGAVYAYIDKALGSWAQRPVFKTHTTRFISLRTVTPQVPINSLRLLPDYFGTASTHFNLDPTYEYTSNSAIQGHVLVMKDLQKFQSVGLVVPVGEDYMYYAAINSKACKLTSLGHYYWALAKSGKL